MAESEVFRYKRLMKEYCKNWEYYQALAGKDSDYQAMADHYQEMCEEAQAALTRAIKRVQKEQGVPLESSYVPPASPNKPMAIRNLAPSYNLSPVQQESLECPPYQFPIDPQHPEFGCRGAVATGGLPSLPAGMLTSTVSTSQLSPSGGYGMLSGSRAFLGQVRLAQAGIKDQCAGAREDVKMAHFKHQSDIEGVKDNQEILQDRIDAGEKNLENSFEALQIKALREEAKKSYADLQKKLKVLQDCLNTIVMQPIRPDEAFARQTMTPPPISSGQIVSEAMQAQGLQVGECPPGQFPEYPGGPCRGAVARGGLPGLPFGSASIMPGTLSPGAGVATSFSGMGRIRVMNLGK